MKVLLVGVFGVGMDDGLQLESEHLDHLQYSTAVPCLFAVVPVLESLKEA